MRIFEKYWFKSLGNNVKEEEYYNYKEIIQK